MEKESLTRFERQCIQEEPPLCTAACPFHVDVKAFLEKMAAQAFDSAFKLLEKALPLPEVLARVCDHPCETACIRRPVDDAIAIGDLERFCLGSRSRQKRYFPSSPKDLAVGIWGSGPSSLACAWDLSLKGYRVSVFFPADRPGGLLNTLLPGVLPPEVLDREIRRMEGFGVVFHPNTSLEIFEETSSSCDALFYGMDGEEPVRKPDALNPFTLGDGDSNRFFGGFSDRGQTATSQASPVIFAFQGRKAATSMDRMLSGVSMAAGRDREGPFDTRLDTDLSLVVPVPRIDFLGRPGQDPVQDLAQDLAQDLVQTADPALAAQEAARCHQCDCSRCVRACNSYIESFGGFPGKYAREIYNNLSIVMGERKANLLTNSCTLCGLCTTVCPNDFSMADLCLSARQEMVNKGKMPASAHEFALAEMAQAMGGSSAFASHGPGQANSEILFFPGCQLTGSAPDQALAAWQWLCKAVTPATGIVAGCCGAPAFWAGRQQLWEAAGAEFFSLWTDWGAPEVVTACTSCSRMLKRSLPGAKISSLYEKMAPAPPRPADLLPAESLAVSDPCTAREDTRVQRAVRTLAQGAGIQVTELAASGELTECCGFGGLTYTANPKLGQKIIENRAGQSSLGYLTYCAMCRDRLAQTGKPAVHILDLFWPQERHPESRPDPGFSRRRSNRVRFRQEVLGIDVAPEPAGPKIRMTEGVRQEMEDQFILVSDLEALFSVLPPDSSGGFCHTKRATRILSHRAGTVRFWVEFLMEGEDIRVTDTWCHRMTVAESRAFVPGTSREDHDAGIVCEGCGKPLAFYKNHVEYLGSRFDVDLPQCPGCGAVYISPKLSRTKMAEVEQILEDK